MKRKRNLSSSDSTKDLLRYAGLGAQMLVSIGLALYIGIKLDGRLNSSPLLTIALPLLVLVGMFYNLVRETRRKNVGPGKNADPPEIKSSDQR